MPGPNTSTQFVDLATDLGVTLSVSRRQRLHWLHVPDTHDGSGVGAWRHDHEGRLYAATFAGVQILDRNGRVRAILPTAGEATSLAFGGPALDRLCVRTLEGTVYVRPMAVHGVAAECMPLALPDVSADNSSPAPQAYPEPVQTSRPR